jgi:hypothetical protein
MNALSVLVTTALCMDMTMLNLFSSGFPYFNDINIKV